MTIAELEREQILERLRECAEAHEDGRQAERARIVAWLRARASWMTLGAENDSDEWAMITALKDSATLIEAGMGPHDVVVA